MISKIQDYIKASMPFSIHFPLLRVKLGILNIFENLQQLRFLSVKKSASTTPQVFYGYCHIPTEEEHARGGVVKFQKLQKIFPNSPKDFNILYIGSSSLPPGSSFLLRLLKEKGIKIVLNQNGVAYPAWKPRRWAAANNPMRTALGCADYVFYQSQFCKRGADKFLGHPSHGWEILFNPVDTAHFFPQTDQKDPKLWNILLAGSQYQEYRFIQALKAFTLLNDFGLSVNLLVTGEFLWSPEAPNQVRKLIADSHLSEKVKLIGPYKQSEAPAIFQQGHILLHTKISDPCPTSVLEAMATGLPVVYSKSGGVPELVGSDAGIGVPTQATWKSEVPPDPHLFASAILEIIKNYPSFRENSRRRATMFFDQRKWVEKHRLIFQELINR